MAEWKEQAIILRLGHFREYDIWIRALLKNRGLHTLFAFGGAKSRRRFCGCLDQLNTIDCRIRVSRNGEYLNLEEAALAAGPRKLRGDWRALGAATNCLRFAEACGIGPESAPECFAIMEAARDLFERREPAPPLAPILFRLRFAAALGYAPDFKTCGCCGHEIAAWGYFLIDAGKVVCPACLAGLDYAQKRHGMRLARPTLDLLQKTRQNFPLWTPREESGADFRQAGRAIDAFTQFHLGLEWDNGTFRRI